MKIADYVDEINKQHQDIFELKKKVDFLESENTRLLTLVNDKLVDFEMEITILKRRMETRK